MNKSAYSQCVKFGRLLAIIFVYLSLCGFFIFPIPLPKSDAQKASELARNGDWHGVINFTTAQIKDNPNNEVLFDFRCNANINLRNLEAAERDCEESIKLLPDRPNPHNNIGVIRQLQNRHIEAIAYFQRAVKIEPKYGLGYANIAVSYNLLGERGKVWDVYQELVKVDESRARTIKTRLSVPDVRPADPIATLTAPTAQLPADSTGGNAEKQAKENPHAEVTEQKAEALGTGKVGAVNSLDLLAAQKLVISEPSNVSAWRELGRRYQEANDADKSIRAYQEAVRLDPNDPNTLEALGILYVKSGQKAKVREVWESLQKVDKARADKFFSAYILP